MADVDHFEYTTGQILGKIVRIVVVDIVPAMVMKPFSVVQYWLFGQDEG